MTGDDPAGRGLASRIARNSAAYAAGNIASRLFDVATIFILARYLGVVDFGKFSFALAYVGLFSILVDWGVNLILVRELSRSGDDAAPLYASGVGLKLALAVGGSLAAAGSVFLLRYPLEVKVLTAIASLNLLCSFRMPSFEDVFEAPLIARLRLRYSALAAAANRVLTLAAVGAAVLLRARLWVVVLVYAAVSIPSLALIVRYSSAVVKPALRARRSDWAYLLKQGFPLGLSIILATVFARLDILLLSRFRPMTEVGIYSAARRLTEPLELIPTALALSVLPVMSRLFGRDEDRIRRIYTRSLLYVLLAAIPLAVLVLSFSRTIVIGLFGAGFAGADKVLVVLSYYLPFIFVWSMGGAVFISVNRQKTNSLIWLGAMVFYAGLDMLLIPVHGALGASLVRAATGIIIASLSVLFVRRFLGPLDFRPLVRLALLTVPVMAASRLRFHSRPVAAVLFFAALFGAGIFLLKIVGPEDLRLLKDSLGHLLPGKPRPSSQ